MAHRQKVPKETKIAILTQAGYRCAVPGCGTTLAIDIHHIVEVSKGGSNVIENLLPLCPTCHALYHRGYIFQESINQWKRRLDALNSTGSAPDELVKSSKPIDLPPCLVIDEHFRILNLENGVIEDSIFFCRNNKFPFLSIEYLPLKIFEEELNSLVSIPTATRAEKAKIVEIQENINDLLVDQAMISKGIALLIAKSEIQDILVNVSCSDIELLIESFLGFFRPGGFSAPGKKFDVWRTVEPELSAPVWLDDEECAHMERQGGSLQSYIFGGFDLFDFPRSVLLGKVLPYIIFKIVQQEFRRGEPIDDVAAMKLNGWAIGLG